MFDVLRRESIDYYLVFLNKKLIGHIGLREIDDSLGTAEIGSFFFKEVLDNQVFLEKVMRFILKTAKAKRLKMVFCDVAKQEDEVRNNVYRKLGFKRDIANEDYWLLELKNPSS